MQTKSRYSTFEFLHWGRMEILFFLGYAFILTFLYHVVDLKFLNLPWLPIGLIGTAVAFIIGFQNNAAYGRIWEARKIWGGIVNYSRTWAMKVKEMVTNEHAANPISQKELDEHIKALVYRHIAWLTALRHSMRQPKRWEEFLKHKTNREWAKQLMIPEHIHSLEDELFPYLSSDDLEYVMNKGNKSTALQFLQAKHLRQLKEQGLIWEFAFLDLMAVQEEFFNLKGKSERIKNFPYPRQYATLGYAFTWIFCIIMPFGLIPTFANIGSELPKNWSMFSEYFIWISIPFSALVSWIFHTMERMGRVGENPFEGSANDVPISNISRAIEIDLRQMLDEESDMIPKQFPEVKNIQM